MRVRRTQGGRKTERGTRVMDRILTVWRTCRRRGLPFLEVVAERLIWAGSGRGPPLPGPTVRLEGRVRTLNSHGENGAARELPVAHALR